MADPETEIAAAIETWYAANYPFGVRLRGQERESLAEFIAQRLGHTTNPLATGSTGGES